MLEQGDHSVGGVVNPTGLHLRQWLCGLLLVTFSDSLSPENHLILKYV